MNKIKVGDAVIVPDPEGEDVWTHSFIGTVIDIIEEKRIAIIEDQDSDCFEVESDRLTPA